MKFMKKTAVITLAIVLVINMNTSVFAKASWHDYIGFDGKPGHTWYEAADGKVVGIAKNKWTAKLKTIGWGGVWGAQIYRNVNIKKGQKCRIKFKIKSTKINKWIVVKICNKNKIAYVKWIHLKKGKYTKVNETFIAKKNATQIYFGLGGEFGDRDDEKDIYAYLNKRPSDGKGDAAGASTKILLRNYSLTFPDLSSKTHCRCGCPYCK
ncbi:hypothetical protein [uncultured Eubacterium sp.]|uniref:hypothetical protein n=1 Tax=uncultured Eubacterium sp. TaxID=165185 RepID=UPI00265D37D3|nr:hypothetical protein [uncultured Eubacterium sp.]